MSYKCRVVYEDSDGEEHEVQLTAEDMDQFSVEEVLEIHDPDATLIDHEFEEVEEGCEITFWDCNGTTQVVHLTVPMGMTSEDMYHYLHRNTDYGPDGAYGYPELLYDSEKKAAERQAEAEEAKKIRVEWDDKDDVLDLFHRCVATLSRDFDISLKKLKKELKENFVEGVMES